MERAFDKRHTKHHKEKHKKHAHKKHRSHSSGTQPSYITVNSTKPLVEYSDVSSEDLSAPEAGEIDSEASPVRVSARISSIRTFVDDKTISVTTTSGRRAVEEYALTRDSCSVARRKREAAAAAGYADAPDADSRHRKKKDKRKKEKKKKRKKEKHRSKSASLESVSPVEEAAVAPAELCEWERPSSPLRNGDTEPVSPSTPPAPPRHGSHVPTSTRHHPHYSPPPRERSPPLRWVYYRCFFCPC